MKSVLSFPDRGRWGDAKWRGNCSGHVIRELVEHFRPKLFVDVCEGSGTSGEVCRDLGIRYVGLDLHRGFDFTRDCVLNHLPHPADIVFSHPPYADMIDYGGIGSFTDPALVARDLSRCQTAEEFLEMSEVMLKNQRLATREGGHYCTLIGDLRKDGDFRSFQADYIGMLPREELAAVVIKAQHHCTSDSRKYRGTLIPILHEYLLVWRKTKKTMLGITLGKIRELSLQKELTWRSLVRLALMNLGGRAALSDLYALIGGMPQAGGLLGRNRNWTAKVRQVLQKYFLPVERGIWSLA